MPMHTCLKPWRGPALAAILAGMPALADVAFSNESSYTVHVELDLRSARDAALQITAMGPAPEGSASSAATLYEGKLEAAAKGVPVRIALPPTGRLTLRPTVKATEPAAMLSLIIGVREEAPDSGPTGNAYQVDYQVNHHGEGSYAESVVIAPFMAGTRSVTCPFLLNRDSRNVSEAGYQAFRFLDAPKVKSGCVIL